MPFWSRLAVALLMSFCCEGYCGETNHCAASSVRFSLPAVHLRAEPRPEAFQVETPGPAPVVFRAPAAGIEAKHVLSDWDFRSDILRSDRFYLTQSKAPPDGGVARFVERIFTPEVVRVGKVSVFSPILTIAKTKNPLSILSAFGTDPDRGLLTFIFLKLSW